MKGKKIKETRPLFHVDDLVYRKDLLYSEPYKITNWWVNKGRIYYGVVTIDRPYISCHQRECNLQKEEVQG